jgi:hypothetical protein
MLDCLIIGDSIAVGISQHRPECLSHARVGITSSAWNKKFLPRVIGAETTVISLGSNDWNPDVTLTELITLREKVKSKKVFWIMPSIKVEVQEMITLIADRYNDNILYVEGTSKDGIHPDRKEYKRLAKEAK